MSPSEYKMRILKVDFKIYNVKYKFNTKEGPVLYNHKQLDLSVSLV